MKKSIPIIVLLIVTFIAGGCSHNTPSKKNIKVGVFNINGDSPWCISDAVEALRIDPEMDVDIISAAKIMSNQIDDYDVILFPGGSGSSETGSLGQLGMEHVIKLTKEKGIGVVGICAGSYALSVTPGYTSLHLSGYQAIDIEHDHRGNGIAKFELTEKGKEFFPELNDYNEVYCQYYEGPVLVPSEKEELKYQSLATMLSDVHLVEGTPANMTNNRPYITISEPGNGRVVTFVGHPESTPGMRWMVPRMARWAAKKEMVSYSEKAINPDFFGKEILFTDSLQKVQSNYYSMLKGSSEEKIEAMNGLINIGAWSAKKKFQGLLRDTDPQVRKIAAQSLLKMERTDALFDLETAMRLEDNPETKKAIEHSIKELNTIMSK